MKNKKISFKRKLTIFISVLILVAIVTLCYRKTKTNQVDSILPRFSNNEIIMFAPAESCGGVTISQPNSQIEHWNYKNDILELKSWRHYIGPNQQEVRVVLASVDWQLADPQEKNNPNYNYEKNFKKLNVLYDACGPTATDYYTISCAKKQVIDGKIQEPTLIDCADIVNLSNLKESDKYLKCSTKEGPLVGYDFKPFNMNIAQQQK